MNICILVTNIYDHLHQHVILDHLHVPKSCASPHESSGGPSGALELVEDPSLVS